MSNKQEKSFSVDLTIEYDYFAGYQPSACHNHDDPRFSDPGEPPLVENLRIIADDEDVTEVFEELMPDMYERFIERAYEEGADR